jgi:hypothetical protein
MDVSEEMLSFILSNVEEFSTCNYYAIHRKQLFRLTPTILIIGAFLYFTRRVSNVSRRPGVNKQFGIKWLSEMEVSLLLFLSGHIWNG